jgi:hypothetical protein
MGGFYKLSISDGGLLFAPNFVMGPTFSLNKNDENKNEMEPVEGWKWFDTETEAYSYFEISAPSNPWTITPLQAKTALHQMGLLSTIETFMLTADVPTKIAWQTASEFKRDSVMLNSISALLGLTSEQVDDLFVLAKTIGV